MLASKQISAYNDPSKAFVGVRFVLFGFDSVREDEVSFQWIFPFGAIFVVSVERAELLLLLGTPFKFRCGRSF